MITWGIHYHNLAPIYLNGMSVGFVDALTNYNNLYVLLLTKVTDVLLLQYWHHCLNQLILIRDVKAYFSSYSLI
jgi:hypothetical protein